MIDRGAAAVPQCSANIAFKGDDERFVVQAVHMLLEGDRQRAWKDGEERVSRLVLIGRNLPKDVIEEGFLACRA
jgi:G3E family GTPase